MGTKPFSRAAEVISGDPARGAFCVRVRTDSRDSCTVIVARGSGYFTWVQAGDDHARAFSVALDGLQGFPSCTCNHFSAFGLCGHVDVLLQLRRQGALGPAPEIRAA